MMNAVVKPYHEMCLNSSELIVPRDTYQRALHPARVARIAKEFDERVANEPKISFRDGHYYVMDGQNTIAARKFLNGGEDLQIRCKVYFGMTEREEALLFAQQTGISERLSAGQKLRALIFAGEPAAVAFQQATELAGVHLSFEEGRGKQRISCIATAYHEFIRLGPELYPQHFKRNLLFFSRDEKSRLNFYIDREVSFMDDMRNTSAPLYGKAEPATTKTTMSVREMRQLLGLGKTDSYWLLHKNLFEVILINDKRRIVISSFEKWYANQVKYHKVNGSPPGEELCKRSYSVPDAAEILKVKPETIYTLIRQGKLKTETTDFCMRIPKEEFEQWYRSQSRYRTAADRERDREIEAQTISIPEMAKLLGIPRKNVYGILDCKKYRDCFVIERVADRPRITKKSFKAWLKSQSTSHLQKSKKETHEEPPLKLQCPKNGKYYSFQEIQAFYGISRPTLDSWVLKEGIPTMKLGRVKRIQKDAFDEVLKSKRKVEEDV